MERGRVEQEVSDLLTRARLYRQLIDGPMDARYLEHALDRWVRNRDRRWENFQIYLAYRAVRKHPATIESDAQAIQQVSAGSDTAASPPGESQTCR